MILRQESLVRYKLFNTLWLILTVRHCNSLDTLDINKLFDTTSIDRPFSSTYPPPPRAEHTQFQHQLELHHASQVFR